MTLKIAIAGIAGRMGRALVCAALEDDRLQIVGGTERSGTGFVGQDIGLAAGARAVGNQVTDDVTVASASAEVWIDFTPPAVVLNTLGALDKSGVRAVVVGATGFSKIEETTIARHGDRMAVVKSGNFSLGVNLMTALIQQAAERLGPDWDIEISEAHHRMKVDAPSGTALMMGKAAADGRGGELADLRLAPYDGITGSRETGKIGFSVTRGGGVIGDHEALFLSPSEIVSIGHRALDRSVFARGALHAARWAADRPAGFYSMRDVLSL